MEFLRYNVYSDDRHMMDFAVPSHRLDLFIDDHWEIEAEPAVECLMNRLAHLDTIAIFDEKFQASMLDDLRKGFIETYVYAKESDFT